MIYAGFVSRLLLAIVFWTAAIGKISEQGAFAGTLRQLGIPPRLSRQTTWLVVIYEAALGLLFALGAWPEIADGAAIALLVVFVGLSISAMMTHATIPCHCFGKSSTHLGSATLSRAALLVLPVGLYYLSYHLGAASWWPTSLSTAITTASLAIAALLFARWLLAARVVKDLVTERRDSLRHDLADQAYKDRIRGLVRR